MIRECEIEKNKRLRVHKFWEGEMGFYKKNFEEKILKKLIWSGWVELFNFLDFFFVVFKGMTIVSCWAGLAYRPSTTHYSIRSYALRSHE